MSRRSGIVPRNGKGDWSGAGRAGDGTSKPWPWRIARAGKPIARLVAYVPTAGRRTGGQWKGLIRIGDDFDAPLPDDLASAFGARLNEDAE